MLYQDGGIRGNAHAGVLKGLEDNGICIEAIGGTSSGGLIAALYAMGYSPYYIYVLFKKYAKEISEFDSTTIISGVGNLMINKKINFIHYTPDYRIEKIDFEEWRKLL